MATGINYCQNGRLSKAKVTLLCFGHRLLAIIRKVFLKKRTLKQFDAYGCYGAIFAFREFKLTMRLRPQRVKANKEALARRILQVRQLLTPPGTCLIDNATILNTMCDALLP